MKLLILIVIACVLIGHSSALLGGLGFGGLGLGLGGLGGLGGIGGLGLMGGLGLGSFGPLGGLMGFGMARLGGIRGRRSLTGELAHEEVNCTITRNLINCTGYIIIS